MPITPPRYKKIFLIDDSEIDNFIHQNLLNQIALSKEIVSFPLGTKVIEYLQENEQQPENLPELILLDIKTPLMDGFGFLDEYQKLPEKTKSKVKIIMLSSTLDKDEIEKARSNPDVLEFLSKPFNTAELLKVL